MDNAAFIHGNLDDFGLRPHTFRVLCHVARRGQCFASIASIANTCRINADTVRKALKLLVQAKLLNVQYRKGQTNIYKVNHLQILNEPLRKEGSTPYEKKGVHPYEKKGVHPYEKRGGKVNPSKSIPLSKGHQVESKMNHNVLLIELGKQITALEKSSKEYRDRHCGEAAGGEYIWTAGCKPRYQEMMSELKVLKEGRKKILMKQLP
jgi:hypothetical protein